VAFPQISPVSLDTLVSTTLQEYLPDMIPQIITSVPAGKAFFDEGVRQASGGTKINVQLLYGFNSTTTWYNYSDYIDLSPQEAVTQAQYKWANLTTAITLFGEEEAANSGDNVIQSLPMAKIKQAELSMSRQLNLSCYGDGTGFFGAACDGLSNLVFLTATPADPPSGAVGGVSAVTFPFWRNYANTSPGAFATNGALGTGTPDNMLRAFNICSDGAMIPTLILSDFGTFESYHTNGLSSNHYRVVDSDRLKGRFRTLDYGGTPWIEDRDCPTQTQYILNTNFLYGVVDTNRFFKPTEWIASSNQDGKVMRIHTRCNLVCSNRMLQGVLNPWT
jgi:hypothetical protein